MVFQARYANVNVWIFPPVLTKYKQSICDFFFIGMKQNLSTLTVIKFA